MNIEHISVSRKGIWNECQYKYKFQYHDKIPPPGEEPFYFIFGKIVHKIAEEYVSNNGKKPIEDISAQVLSGKVLVEANTPAPPTSSWPKAYMPRLPGMLRSIVNMSDKIGYDGTDHLEYEFRYDLDPPNDRYVKGFIDRLTIKDGLYRILDYKTTKKGPYRKDRSNIMYDLQLRAYASIVQKDFDVPVENIRAALFYLEGSNLVGARFTQESLDSAQEELLEAYRQIEATKPERAFGRVGRHCTRCQYNSLCHFYNPKNL